MALTPTGAALLGLYLLVGAIHIIGCYREHRCLMHVSKPLLMPLLLATYVSTLLNRSSILIVLALAFDTVGDVLLMYRKRNRIRFLIFGMIAFMIGHVCYATWFFTRHVSFSIALPWVCGLIFSIALTIWFWNTIRASGHRYYRVLFFYVFFIDALIIGSLYTWGSGNVIGTLLCVAGALLLSLSDFLIAMETVGQRNKDKNCVMLTYILAQLLFVSGIILLS